MLNALGAQGAPTESGPLLEAVPLAVEAPIEAVTVYPGRATVTRAATISLEPGVYDLQFADLPEVAAMIHRGRSYLIGTQESDGGWPETTRPSGNLSYAHRISTTGWATQALLVSNR